jgi:hypothetical protein
MDASGYTASLVPQSAGFAVSLQRAKLDRVCVDPSGAAA